MNQKSFSGGGFNAPIHSTHSAQPLYGQRCYHSHPQLLINGGKFIGGSCINPVTDTADIYIGFDHGMSVSRHFEENTPIQVFCPIPDMGVPENLEVFRKLVFWTADRLKEGKTVHAGCIGGHGRTGMFLAALYKTVYGHEDAITKVREIYCQKAVESAKQVQWLHQHFGIKVVAGAKEHYGTNTGRQSSYTATNYGTAPKPLNHGGKTDWPKATGGAEFKSKPTHINPPQQQSFKGASEVYKADPASKETIWGALF